MAVVGECAPGSLGSESSGSSKHGGSFQVTDDTINGVDRLVTRLSANSTGLNSS